MSTNDAAALVPLITTTAQIVTGVTVRQFNDNVARASHEGWRPSGQVFILNTDPAIMMVKYDQRVTELFDPLLAAFRNLLQAQSQ